MADTEHEPTSTREPYSGAGAPPPPIPANRFRFARQQLRFFPMLRAEEDHPKTWTFPSYLDNPAVPWLMVLKEMYAMPLAFPASFSPEAGLLLHALVRS